MVCNIEKYNVLWLQTGRSEAHEKNMTLTTWSPWTGCRASHTSWGYLGGMEIPRLSLEDDSGYVTTNIVTFSGTPGAAHIKRPDVNGEIKLRHNIK